MVTIMFKSNFAKSSGGGGGLNPLATLFPTPMHYNILSLDIRQSYNNMILEFYIYNSKSLLVDCVGFFLSFMEM